MSDAKGQPEPSMEEILASIRRIIAEDGEPVAETGAAPAPATNHHDAAEDDVLELTEVVEDEPPPDESLFRPLEPESEDEPDPEPLPIFEPRPAPRDDRLVSDSTAQVSKAAFAALASRSRRRMTSDVLLGNGDLTLEEIVKELLRPMLKEWLDANLPGLVERTVRDEIERLGREAGS